MKHYKKRWNGEEVVIDNDLDPSCELYHGEECLGEIKSDTTLVNVLAQIRLKQLSESESNTPYHIKFNDRKIEITSKGRILNPPKGFYDQNGKALKVLFG